VKAIFICFTGIDGSGKSTLAGELVKWLNNRGIKCQYVYARQNPFILRPFIFMGRLIFLRGKSQFGDYAMYATTKKKAIKSHSFLWRIYQQIFWLDYLPQVFLKVKLSLASGKNIVCDRYVYDALITDLAVDMNYSKDRLVGLLYKLLRFLPKPDVTFLVDLPEELAWQRKDDIPSIEYLRERRKIYLEVGKAHEMFVLDGSKKIEDLKCEIEAIVCQQIQL